MTKMPQNIYDFIGLQEASNYEQIFKGLLLKNPNYRYTHHTSGLEDMITIYDSSRFKLDYISTGEFDSGRPHQILYLSECRTNNKFIVINLHAPHTIFNKNKFSTELTKNMHLAIIGDDTNMENINIKINTQNITKYINDNAKIFNTIVMGDFNDHGKLDTWDNFQVFNGSKIDSIKHITVSTNGIEPPKTCCVGHSLRKTKGEDKRYGDYILIDNSKMDYIINNQIPKFPEFYNATTFPTSDHLPVYSEIIIKLLAQPMPAQPMPAQPMPAQPMPAQPMPAQPMPAQPMPAQNLLQNIKYKLLYSKTLRLQPISDDPNRNEKLNNLPFKGSQVNKDDIVIPSPILDNTSNKRYILVKKESTDIIGYINYDYLEQNGKFYKLKDKNDEKLLRIEPKDDTNNNLYLTQEYLITVKDNLLPVSIGHYDAKKM
jgi:hypothetical protein